MVKKSVAVILVAMLVLVCAGCGNGSSASGNAEALEAVSVEASSSDSGAESAAEVASSAEESESSAEAASEEEKPDLDYEILYLPAMSNMPYAQTVNTGAQAAAAELGITVIYDGPTEWSAESQVAMVENYMALGVDAMIIEPLDPEALVDVVQSARRAGILVLELGSRMEEEQVDGFVCGVIR